MANRQAWHRVAWAAAGALAFAASGVSAQEAPSARAVVSASATLVAPVEIQAPASLAVVAGREGLALEGRLAVRSPAPHVISAHAQAWARGASLPPSQMLSASWRATPRSVRVELAPATPAAPLRLTYVVAVAL